MTENAVLHLIASSKFGGGSKHILLLSKLDGLKNKSIFAVQENSYLDQELGINAHKVRITHRLTHLISFAQIFYNIHLHSIKVIHAHGRGAAAIARFIKLIKLGRIKIIYTLHGVHKEFNSTLFYILYKFYEIIFSRLDDHRVFVSESEEREYCKFQQKADRGRHKIIYNAIENRSMDTSTSNTYDIGVLTRFHAQKNLRRFVKIAKLLPEYSFVIGGDGPEYNKINDLISLENIKNVKLLGYCSDPSKFMKSIRVYLSTSLWEGMPYSVLEAISHNKPIVLSNVVGHQDFRSGRIDANFYDTDNNAAEILRNLLKRKEEYEKAVQVSQTLQSKFSYTTFKKDMTNLYLGILKR